MSRFRGLALMIVLSQVALGANVIELWGPGASYYQAGTHYRIDPINRTIQIWQGSDPNIPWYFEAYDDETGDGGVIDLIEIVPTGPVGTIRLSIIPDPNNVFADPNYGALDVKRIDLVTDADPNTANTLERLSLWGDSAAVWASWWVPACARAACARQNPWDRDCAEAWVAGRASQKGGCCLTQARKLG
jgi:hypothetical protein